MRSLILQSRTMRARATLRASVESGNNWDDPSEDHLFMLVEDIERGDESYLIVERLSDSSGQSYIQTMRNEDGGFLVERRDGVPDKHFQTTASDFRHAHALIVAWAFGEPEVATPGEWLPVIFDG